MITKQQRCLRSKSLRNALAIASDMKCTMCGIELTKSFHADHITPWVVEPTTNPHQMQALCPTCNLSKGATHLSKISGDSK